jgi:4-hydroxybenzoyl-CoA thioesterase/acyl-CoA thioester hydrolase
MERFFSECCNVEYSSLIRDEHMGFPTVKSDAEFLTPIIYGDTIEIDLQPLETGNSSLHLHYQIRRQSDGVTCARIRQVHVAMNLSTKRAVPIPEKIRVAFQAFR